MGDLKLQLDDAVIADLSQRAEHLGLSVSDYVEGLLLRRVATGPDRGRTARAIRAHQLQPPPMASETLIRALRDA